jgi:hypothetical protein
VLRAVERSGGCLVVLWHNIFISRPCYTGWRGLYERILDWGRRRGALMATREEICKRTTSARAQ